MAAVRVTGLGAVLDTELVVAAVSTGAFAGRTAVPVDALVDVRWITAPASHAEPLLGVWPGPPNRPDIVHCARDWLTKLQVVAGGFGVTTVPSRLSPVLPPGVSLLRVDGAPPEIRRVLVARLPGRPTPTITAVIRALPRPPDPCRPPLTGAVPWARRGRAPGAVIRVSAGCP
ncbi:LysR substrate-binding domain-containing protein [Streptomyces longwoodensis]|uniref:LysR substrate-binding domain-containing protein n=1 Tax=Streptomyces longwoodensis TaxID=68231 RepID=UPI0033DAE06D